MTLGSRFAATYAAVILIALLVFAAVAVVAIDRTLRASMDGRLNTEAHAAASLADVEHGTIVIDEEDRRQFLTLIAAGDDGLVLDAAGKIVLSSTTTPPLALLSLERHAQRYYTAGKGQSMMRALVFPVLHKGENAGTVIVWRASDWVGDSDRSAAIAFAIAAVIIAILALVAGDAVTRRALADAFERQRRFTADASHELRAPLAVIRAESDLALRKERSGNEYRVAMETIADEADRMENLIGDLLSAARAESGRVAREHVDLSEVVRRVADRLAAAAKTKNATIDVEGSEPAIILADRHAIERAILSIAHNAVKYANEQGRVSLQVARHGATVELTVYDTGPGFTRDALDHALERFWRDSAGRVQDGTGLGLAIARSIVEAAGGTIALENQNGGALVRLRFPAAVR